VTLRYCFVRLPASGCLHSLQDPSALEVKFAISVSPKPIRKRRPCWRLKPVLFSLVYVFFCCNKFTKLLATYISENALLRFKSVETTLFYAPSRFGSMYEGSGWRSGFDHGLWLRLLASPLQEQPKKQARSFSTGSIILY